MAGVVAISVVEGEHYIQGVARNTETPPKSNCTYGTGRSREKRKRIAVLDNLFTRYSSYLVRLTRIGDSLALFGGAIGFNDSQDLQVILVAALLDFWRTV